jgi:ketosteroid isomerase-like protein
MSQENAQCSAHLWELFVAGDTPGVLAFLDPNLEVHDPPSLPGAGVYYGHTGWQAQMDKFAEAFTNLTYEPLEHIDCGETVISVIRATGTATSSGISGETTYAQVEDWRDGKVVSLRYFISREEALEALGLSE